jgi:hypothetical protein
MITPLLHGLLFFALANAAAPPDNRVATLLIAQDLINEQLDTHVKSNLVKETRVELDPEQGQISLRGKLQVPTEELRAVNLDPSLGAFRFQITIKPEVTKNGYFILEFPLAETFFYPADSKNPRRDRVIIPVQMLSLALASVRGYLAALSGDFSGFDRRTASLSAEMKEISRQISHEKNSDKHEALNTQKESLRLQLAAVPIERKQLETVAKEVEHILGFTGEKELNLNDDLGARRNALILKIRLSQLVPYLNGVDLGGLRIVHDKKDGAGENFLAIDINSSLAAPLPLRASGSVPHGVLKVAPSLIVRLNQSLFESEALVNAEKKAVASKVRDLDIQLKDDGLHVTGGWKTFLFTLPFDTIVDFVSVGSDVFEIRIREMKVAGLGLTFMTKFILDAIKNRLDHALNGMCAFAYVGEEKDQSRAIQVTVKPEKLVPAFPNLHLIEVAVRDREFLLKLGQTP